MIIKGFPLIKFQSAERIQSLQNGLLYMNSLEWYRKHEQENGDTVIGDLFEGMFHINEGQFTIPALGETFDIRNDLFATNASNDFVYCMFGVNPYCNSFDFSPEQKEAIIDFGNTALLDRYEFFNRIRIAASKENYEIYGKFVQYYDSNVDSVNLIYSLLDGTHNIAFWKRKEYIYQQEYRFLIHAPNCTKDHIELNIGDIHDISKVFKTSDILNAKVVKIE